MKQKSILYTVLFFLIAQTTFAQNTEPKTSNKTTLGIQAGANLFGTRGDNSFPNEFDSKIDLWVGVNFEHQLKPGLHFKSNINYERNTLGLETESLGTVSTPPEDVELTYTFHYLTVPLLLKYSFTKNKTVFINGGPFVGFLLNETGKINGESADFAGDSVFKVLNAGLSFGIGKRFKLNQNNSLDIELRDNLGLLNMFKEENPTARTNTLMLIAAWNFQL